MSDDVRFVRGPHRGTTRSGARPRFAEGLWRLAPGAHAWLVPNGSWGESNVGLVECGGASVLVDTCWDLPTTREVLEGMGELLAHAPVEHLVNTHADGDHCWGNQLLPGRRVHAAAGCAGPGTGPSPRALTALGLAARALAPLAGAPGRLGRYLHGMLAPYDFAGVRPAPPEVTFSGEHVLSVNGVELLLVEVGPAHTEGDALVHVPSRGVTYAGDVLFAGATPVLWSGTVERVVAALRRLRALGGVIVPGHGPLAGAADVALALDYWELLQEGLHPAFRRGVPPGRAARELALAPRFRASPFARWDGPERMVANAHALYRQWGAPSPRRRPGRLGLLRLLQEQAELAAELAGRADP